MMKIRKGNINSFTLGAILYGSFFAGLILIIYKYLENPNKWAIFLLVILGLIVIFTLIYVIRKKQIWNFVFGFKPTEPLEDVENIIQSLREEKDSEALKYVKRLAIYWAALKGRISLIQFSLFLLTLVAGFSSMGVLYSQLNEMNKTNKLTQKSLEQFRKQNEYLKEQMSLQWEQFRYQKSLEGAKRKTVLLSYLYDKKINDIPKYNSKIRQNALNEYIKMEKPIKQKNIVTYLSRHGTISKSANSDNQINLSKALLQGIEFGYHDLTSMRLDHVNFGKATLTYIDFNNSNLDYSNFQDAVLTEVNLSNTTMLHVNFYNTKVSNVTWNIGGNKYRPVLCCNIYGISGISDKMKNILLNSGGYVEEENLTKWNECLKDKSILKN